MVFFFGEKKIKFTIKKNRNPFAKVNKILSLHPQK